MIAILSDIHGNLPALQAVATDMQSYPVEGIVLLGDLIDYGMQSNETVRYIRSAMQDRILVSIWGNHERAILLSDFTRFSSRRGAECAQYTASRLTDQTRAYLDQMLIHDGCHSFELGGKRVLAVHGSLEDVYWKAITPDQPRGDYSAYDLVLSGHSHDSHVFTRYYDCQDPDRRNKHAVLFINPGSVGQPRNHHPEAQYVLLDKQTLSVCMRAVPYDVEAAMAAYDGHVDDFYRSRLAFGV